MRPPLVVIVLKRGVRLRALQYMVTLMKYQPKVEYQHKTHPSLRMLTRRSFMKQVGEIKTLITVRLPQQAGGGTAQDGIFTNICVSSIGCLFTYSLILH